MIEREKIMEMLGIQGVGKVGVLGRVAVVRRPRSLAVLPVTYTSELHITVGVR